MKKTYLDRKSIVRYDDRKSLVYLNETVINDYQPETREGEEAAEPTTAYEYEGSEVDAGTFIATVSTDITEVAEAIIAAGVNCTLADFARIAKTLGTPDGEAFRKAARKLNEHFINRRTDAKILTGFKWNGKPVYLSQENQFNFKAAFDLATQTQGATLPVKFKLGEDENGEAVFHTFRELAPLTDFYTKAIAFIQSVLDEGWQEKYVETTYEGLLD